MNTSIDITLLPIAQNQQQIEQELSAVFVAHPSRQVARGRGADRLIIYLPNSNNLALERTMVEKYIQHIQNGYYKTRGTVTSAMRFAAEELNQIFLSQNDRNLQQRQNEGITPYDKGTSFTFAVLRLTETTQPTLLIAQCGSTQIVYVNAHSAKNNYDAQRSGRGLGVSRSLPIHFLQFEVRSGEYFLWIPNPTIPWEAPILHAAYGLALEKTHLHLLNHTKIEPNTAIYSSILLQVHSGSGSIHLVKPHSHEMQPIKQDHTVEPPKTPQAVEQQMPKSAEPPPMIEEVAHLEAEISIPQPEPASLPITGAEQTPTPSATPKKNKEANSTPISERFRFISTIKNVLLLKLYQQSKHKKEVQQSKPIQIPSSIMAGIAVLVPIIVVAITSIVYLQRGLSSLNEDYYLQAQSLAVEALGKENPKQKRSTILESISLLDKAESYKETVESIALRDYLEASIDELDNIVRLDFQPVLSGRLPANVNIKRIFLIGDDLYLFNAAEGNVLRATRTAQGFDIDPSFYCGPGPKVSALVDVSPLSWNTDAVAVIIGIDKAGNLLYCGEKQSYQTLPVPEKGWGSPQFMLTEFSRLYVLDTKTNAIWVYASKEENDFSEQPLFLFSEKAPNIQDVLSMTIYRGDLYLLHKESRLTKCVYNFWYQTSTHCEESTSFTEVGSDKTFRQIKRSDGSIATISQIIYAPPPDPSIYILDGETLSIYHLSLRLTIQQQYRAQKDLTRPASAFYIGPNRTVYLAVGNNVYFAALP